MIQAMQPATRDALQCAAFYTFLKLLNDYWRPHVFLIVPLLAIINFLHPWRGLRLL